MEENKPTKCELKEKIVTASQALINQLIKVETDPGFRSALSIAHNYAPKLLEGNPLWVDQSRALAKLLDQYNELLRGEPSDQ